MRKILITIAIGFIAFAGYSQPLDTLIGMAMEQNPELQSLYLRYRAALERGPQMSELPDMEVGVGVSILPVETRLGPQWTRVGVTQMFPWMGTLKAREEVMLTMARVEYEKAEAVKQELAFQVRQSYYNLYGLRQRQEIIRRNLRFFDGLEELALSNVESGQATAADVLRVQLKIQEWEQQLEVLENREQKPLAQLNKTLNRPLDTPVTVSDTLSEATVALDREALVAYLRENHPRFRMLDVQQEVARQEIELNNLNRKPSFGVGMDYIFTGKRNDAEPVNNGRDALGLRGMVKIPLFTDKYAAKEQEELLRIEALEREKEQWEDQFLAQVEMALADFRETQLELQLYLRQQATLQSAIDILTTRYSTEGRGFDELLELQIDQIGYDLKIVEAVVDSHLAKAEIERLTDFDY